MYLHSGEGECGGQVRRVARLLTWQHHVQEQAPAHKIKDQLIYCTVQTKINKHTETKELELSVHEWDFTVHSTISSEEIRSRQT
jgi:hypothetical protein